MLKQNKNKQTKNPTFLILSLKWMQRRQAGVPGMEWNPSLEKSVNGQGGLSWVSLGSVIVTD